MNKDLFIRITQLVRQEITPATGCTEPASVALAVAYASSLLPEYNVERIEVKLSANMLKNAMGVGIPGTGMIGIPIAIALGAVLASPEKQLELLNQFTPEDLQKAKSLVDQERISIELQDAPETNKLYVEVSIISPSGDVARAVIRGLHTNLVELKLNEENCLQSSVGSICPDNLSSSTLSVEQSLLSFDLIYAYSMEEDIEVLDFIYQAALKNKEVSSYAQEHRCGHNLGRLIQSPKGVALLGTSPLTYMLSCTTAACDARMDGVSMTVMSNSGSGNQGITATIPVLAFGEVQGVDREMLTRALMLSSLLVIYVKQELGRLSGLCGMVVSGVGVAAALTYMLGGSKEQSGYAIKNMIANLTGMICDGAKPSCSLKASSGISSAMIAALLAIENEVVSPIEGIISSSVDECIHNLATIGCQGMAQTDRQVLSVMTHKGKSV